MGCTPEQIELSRAIINFITAIVALGGVIFGLSRWRKEHIAKKKLDFSESVVEAFYKVENAIEFIRSPIGMPMDDDTGRSPFAAVASDERPFATKNRYNYKMDDFNHLMALRFRFRLIISKDGDYLFREIERVVLDVINAERECDRLDKILASPPNNIDVDETIRKKRQAEFVMWASPHGDETAQRVKDVIAKVESLCESGSKDPKKLFA